MRRSSTLVAACLAALGCQGERDATLLGAPHEAAPESVEGSPGGDLTSSNTGTDAFRQQAPASNRDQQLLFISGRSFYLDPWLPPPSVSTSRRGLGPLFNASACADCHLGGGRGQPPGSAEQPFAGLVLQLGSGERDARGAPLADPVYGEQLQTQAIAGVAPEGLPALDPYELTRQYADGTQQRLSAAVYRLEQLRYGAALPDLRISPRIAPATIGLGLLEAIPVARLEELEDPADRNGDGISGRLNRVWERSAEELAPGRFGWKAEQPSLRQQIAAALAYDIGVTSLAYPESDCAALECGAETAAAATQPELNERVLDRLELYLRLLAVPERRHADEPSVQRGAAWFANAGCASCHVPQHLTSSEVVLPELREQEIWPYTDLLLHDLGPELADERASFLAEGAEWRTPPLWGMGLSRVVSGHQRLLHDGRADGVSEAILWHGGEALRSRRAFEALSAEQRAELVAFVESL
ncbi:MAG: hypothetical protein RL685_2283 [Pseudomonadota bacterium]|jgi:CxxC motif-containing protein (DUF1111 family)